MFRQIREQIVTVLSILLCLFTLLEVNFPRLQPQSQIAFFVLCGMVLCFVQFPIAKRWKENDYLKIPDLVLAGLTFVCCAYVIVQTEPVFRDSLWSAPALEGVDPSELEPVSLGSRSGSETRADFWIGLIGIVLVLEVTRRSIGWVVPLLACAFMLHSFYCHEFQLWVRDRGPSLPVWLFPDLNELPAWILPHRGQSVQDIVSATFLQLGVFGTAASVMFRYVFLFVVFGSFLELSGATKFIIDFSERIFGRTPGGPAKVSVLGAGLMGSLSGSAVANAVTTGSFTIPMMRSAGFRPYVAGGITAAAASGGALVPPVMGAGAYMMLELVPGDISFLQIARAALIPAILYYFSIFMIVHFYSLKIGTTKEQAGEKGPLPKFEAVAFFGALGALVGLLLLGFSPFRAVTGSLVFIMLLAPFRPVLKLSGLGKLLCYCNFAAAALVYLVFIAEPADNQGIRQIFDLLFGASIVGLLGMLVSGLVPPHAGAAVRFTASVSLYTFFHVLALADWSGSLGAEALRLLVGALIYGLGATVASRFMDAQWHKSVRDAILKSSRNGISLVAASACVGIIIGIVGTTPIASNFSAEIKEVVQSSLFLALVGIMGCSIVLGMGVPSVVCYLLMATLMGPLLSELGVIPLAAHLFIFYFGMMSMVTPPVALAAYASASIADARIMPTALAAFQFSLVGFTLPFMFVYRPALLLMDSQGGLINLGQMHSLAIALLAALAGILSLAAGITGYLKAPLGAAGRTAALVAAALLLSPNVAIGDRKIGAFVNIVGGALFVAVAIVNWRQSRSANTHSRTAPES